MHENRETSVVSEREPVTDRAEQAQSRTAAMYDAEESDSGKVPRNRPNNGGKPPAEAEEGRPGTNENIAPLRTCPTQGGESVSQGCVVCVKEPSIRSRKSSTGIASTLTLESPVAGKCSRPPGRETRVADLWPDEVAS